MRYSMIPRNVFTSCLPIVAAMLGFADAAALRAPAFPPGVEVAGPVNKFKLKKQLETVAVLVDFPDNRADTLRFSAARFDSMLYSTGVYNGQKYRRGSLRDYFLEISYGTFSVAGGVAGKRWFRSVNNYSKYYDGDYMASNGGDLARDNIQQVDASVDFRQFDLDHDGSIDAMFMVHAGADGADDGDVNHCWSHAIPSFEYETNDGVIINGVTNVPEFALVTETRDTTMCCIAVMSHELGHLAGLPDLYDYSRETWGVGYWGLMGYGAWGAGGNTPWSPAHMEAWSKIKAGFVTPQVITKDVYNLRIPNVETNPVIYKVWRGGTNSDTCFYLENRRRKGFDSLLPGAGLLVWHVDPGQGTEDDIVDLEEDSTFHLDKGNGVRPDPYFYHDTLGRASDPLPGSWNRTSITDATVPGLRDNKGNPTGIGIKNIRLSGDTVVCDVLVGVTQAVPPVPAVSRGAAAAGPNPFRSAVTISFPPAGKTTVYIYDYAGTVVRRFSTPGSSISWDGCNDAGLRMPSGMYPVQIQQRNRVTSLHVLRLK